jgi:hypothetical protein
MPHTVLHQNRLQRFVASLKLDSSAKRLMALVAVFAVVGSSVAMGGRAQALDFSAIVIRMYQPTTGEHFYTTNLLEYKAILDTGTFRSEGIGFNAWTGAAVGSKPVYRLIPQNGGKHFFTMSETEKNALASSGWRVEGVAWYAYSTAGANRLPVYRLYNSVNGDHLLTTSAAERDGAARSGYRYEGIAFYTPATTVN